MLEGFREGLILHVKQLAWLHAVPEKKKESRGEELRRRFGEDCREVDLPSVDGCEHLVSYLFEVGPSVRGEELTHGDLRSYQENTGTFLDEFDASMMVRMSREYLAQYRKASAKTCPAPWRRERTPEELEALAALKAEARRARQQKK